MLVPAYNNLQEDKMKTQDTQKGGSRNAGKNDMKRNASQPQKQRQQDPRREEDRPRA